MLYPSPWQRPSAVLAGALLLDVTCGEPPAALHPVVWIGRLIAALEHRAPRTAVAQALYGAGLALAVPAVAAGAAYAGESVAASLVRRSGWPGVAAVALLLKPAVAARMLLDAGGEVERALARADLDAARAGLHALVSRDVSALGPGLLAAAAIESLGENVSDALVAPLLWYVVAGMPGAWAYRAINTADSMNGYRGAYEWLGKAAARLDDLANLLPARLTALLIVAAAALCGADGTGSWRTLRRDAARTASPNAGWPMAALAGALGVRLEKVGHYVLNAEGAEPDAATIRRAREIVGVTIALATIVAAMLAAGGTIPRRLA